MPNYKIQCDHKAVVWFKGGRPPRELQVYGTLEQLKLLMDCFWFYPTARRGEIFSFKLEKVVKTFSYTDGLAAELKRRI